ELLRLLGVTPPYQLHRALDIGKEHRDLLTLTFEGTAGEQDFLSEIGREVKGTVLKDSWGRIDRGSGAPSAAPDEAMPRIFTYLRVRVQEFGLEIIESALVQVKLSLERLIGHTLTLAEEGQDLIEDCVEVHPISSSSHVQKWLQPQQCT